MTERPILMSAPMVRACLREIDPKTQTRRVLRDQQPIDLGASTHGTHLSRRPVHDHGKLVGHRLAPVHCPYGQPRDRLWVRETFCVGYALGDGSYTAIPFQGCEAHRRAFYRATNPDAPDEPRRVWKPAIHMPRWASRLMLDVGAVRVERLQDCSEADAQAEGIDAPTAGSYRAGYALLWDSLNEKRGHGWAKNPWVWVIEFGRVNG